MRISFDIDDTLVLHSRHSTRPEPGRFPRFIRRWLGEPLRRDTCELLRELRRRQHEIWIYTTSGRTPFRIRLWLFLYGIRVDGIVNQDLHSRELTGMQFSRAPSKYPPAFGIDLHVDDSEGVLIEGQQHGFRVVVVKPSDELWANKVLAAITDSSAG